MLVQYTAEFISESIQAFSEQDVSCIVELHKMNVECLAKGGKLLVFGNGGSNSDAAHFVGEILGRFENERCGIPACHLDTGGAIGSAIANDYGFENVFSRQIDAIANKNDLAIGISTSGCSINVIKGLDCAKRLGCKTVLLTSNKFNPDQSGFFPHLVLKSPTANTAICQQCHILVLHSLCRLLDHEYPSIWRQHSR